MVVEAPGGVFIRVLCVGRVWSLKSRALAQALLGPATRAMEEYAAIFIRRLWRLRCGDEVWDLILEKDRRKVRARRRRDEVEFIRVIPDLEAMEKREKKKTEIKSKGN